MFSQTNASSNFLKHFKWITKSPQPTKRLGEGCLGHKLIKPLLVMRASTGINAAVMRMRMRLMRNSPG